MADDKLPSGKEGHGPPSLAPELYETQDRDSVWAIARDKLRQSMPPDWQTLSTEDRNLGIAALDQAIVRQNKIQLTKDGKTLFNGRALQKGDVLTIPPLSKVYEVASHPAATTHNAAEQPPATHPELTPPAPGPHSPETAQSLKGTEVSLSPAQSYRTKDGESVWKIAQHKLQESMGAEWQTLSTKEKNAGITTLDLAIVRENNLQITKDGKALFQGHGLRKGDVLTIPSIDVLTIPSISELLGDHSPVPNSKAAGDRLPLPPPPVKLHFPAVATLAQLPVPLPAMGTIASAEKQPAPEQTSAPIPEQSFVPPQPPQDQPLVPGVEQVSVPPPPLQLATLTDIPKPVVHRSTDPPLPGSDVRFPQLDFGSAKGNDVSNRFEDVAPGPIDTFYVKPEFIKPETGDPNGVWDNAGQKAIKLAAQHKTIDSPLALSEAGVGVEGLARFISDTTRQRITATSTWELEGQLKLNNWQEVQPSADGKVGLRAGDVLIGKRDSQIFPDGIATMYAGKLVGYGNDIMFNYYPYPGGKDALTGKVIPASYRFELLDKLQVSEKDYLDGYSRVTVLRYAG